MKDRKAADRHPPPLLMNNPLRNVLERRDRFDSFIREGDTVADVGCGSGYYTLRFADITGESGQVYASDTNASAVQTLSRKAAGRGNIHISTAPSDSMTSIPDSSVDFLLSNLTLCCLTGHDASVAEMERVMKKGGTAYVSITTFGRKSDPRRLSPQRFEELMGRFDIIERKKGRTVYSMLVRKR